MLDDYLEKCAVIGAGGKMGRGVALLLLQEMARIEVERSGKIAGNARLFLVDINDEALGGLQAYLRAQLVRYAEKSIVALRNSYQDRNELVENHEVITDFVNGALSIVRLGTDIQQVGEAKLIFEAVVENLEVKTRAFSALKSVCGDDAYFLTNTSSIPISALDEKAGLDGRLIGYHFYNPPPVQKLVEVISTPKTDKKLQRLAAELGKRLRKTLVPSNDVAGFIGNGHFMREALFGTELAAELEKETAPHEAVYMVNKVSQDFLVRPMGIFQLLDYVGLDVCQTILKMMSTYIQDEKLQSNLVDKMIEAGAKGGQLPDGSQKDGFFKYVKGRPAGVFSLKDKDYISLDEGDWVKTCNARLADPPREHLPWKALLRDRRSDDKLRTYFSALFKADTPGAALAKRYLLRSRQIANQLVEDGIANNITDVNTVLMNGFNHLYGPENDYF